MSSRFPYTVLDYLYTDVLKLACFGKTTEREQTQCAKTYHQDFMTQCKTELALPNSLGKVEDCEQYFKDGAHALCQIVADFAPCGDSIYVPPTTTRPPPPPPTPAPTTTTTAPFPIVHTIGGFALGALITGIILIVMFLICHNKKSKSSGSSARTRQSPNRRARAPRNPRLNSPIRLEKLPIQINDFIVISTWPNYKYLAKCHHPC